MWLALISKLTLDPSQTHLDKPSITADKWPMNQGLEWPSTWIHFTHQQSGKNVRDCKNVLSTPNMLQDSHVLVLQILLHIISQIIHIYLYKYYMLHIYSYVICTRLSLCWDLLSTAGFHDVPCLRAAHNISQSTLLKAEGPFLYLNMVSVASNKTRTNGNSDRSCPITPHGVSSMEVN